MKICNEMLKLRRWLDKNHIQWVDASDVYEDFVHDLSGYRMNFTIYRTHFEYKSETVSVSYGMYTYGAEDGLLEMWLENSWDSPAGYMTAKEVIEELKAIKK